MPGLKILLIEDRSTDAELIIRLLRKKISNPEIKHLSELNGLENIIPEFDPDIILSDFSLPGATGLEVMGICKRINEDTPFIIVTGAIDEETAVDCIKAGASDYILKDNLIRLVPAIEGAYEKSLSLQAKRKAEKSLQESEARYRNLFRNMIEGFAYHKIILDENGNPISYKFIEVNPAFEKLTGLKRKDIIGKTINEVLPETENYWIDRYGEVALTGKNIDFSNYSESINKHFQIYAFSPEPEHFVTVFTDITKRIEYEEKLKNYQIKLKALNNKLLLVEEKEKRRLAVNLHDHFSQLLAISKMRLTELINQKNFSKEKGQLSEVRDYIEKALTNSRKLTYELSPPVLYELGLIKTIKWHLDNECERNGIEYELNCPYRKLSLNENTQIILYRVFSEIVTNIIKHANANRIFVFIEKQKDNLTLKVQDNGKGFKVNNIQKKSDSFGLFSIRERIEYLNGIFKINSEPHKGTEAVVTVPLN